MYAFLVCAGMRDRSSINGDFASFLRLVLFPDVMRKAGQGIRKSSVFVLDCVEPRATSWRCRRWPDGAV